MLLLPKVTIKTCEMKLNAVFFSFFGKFGKNLGKNLSHPKNLPATLNGSTVIRGKTPNIVI